MRNNMKTETEDKLMQDHNGDNRMLLRKRRTDKPLSMEESAIRSRAWRDKKRKEILAGLKQTAVVVKRGKRKSTKHQNGAAISQNSPLSYCPCCGTDLRAVSMALNIGRVGV
jgi:hypothetical protein